MAASKNVFHEAVEATPEISTSYCAGLQALGSDSAKVIPANPRQLDGSVDIDAATLTLYPNAARWDYAVGYSGKVYFIEVHPANTSNVKEMLAKAKWLTDWLKAKAPALKLLMVGNSYYWVSSDESKISRNSPQYKQLAQSRVRLMGRSMRLP